MILIDQPLLATRANERLCITQEAVGSGANAGMANGMQKISARLRIAATDIGDIHLSCLDSVDGEAVGIEFDHPKLLKHPLI